MNQALTTQAMQLIRDPAGIRDAAIDDMCNALLRLVDDLDTLNPEGMRSWIENNIPNPLDPSDPAPDATRKRRGVRKRHR